MKPSRMTPESSATPTSIATIALFIALGGAAVAAGLPKNSVGPKQLRRGAVTAGRDRKRRGRPAPSWRQRSVIVGKLGPSAVLPGNIGNGGITTDKIAAGAVIAGSIKNGVITNNKLGNEVVTTTKLGKGSVTAAKLGADVAPLLGTLRMRQTLRGTFDLGGETELARGWHQLPVAAAESAGGAGSQHPRRSRHQRCLPRSHGRQQTDAGSGGRPALRLHQDVERQSAETRLRRQRSVNRLGFGLRASFEEPPPRKPDPGLLGRNRALASESRSARARRAPRR